MNCKISIVVPIYNAEKFLERCIDSIINQTYKNLEIVLVNDGSTDKSLDICNNYKKNDKRIKIIDKKNGGEATARNAGINNSTGDYLAFVDSDDWINPRYVEILYKNIKKGNFDLAVCSYIRATKNIECNIAESKNYCVKKLNKKESFDNLATNYAYYGYCWNKLYKIDILRKLGDKPVDENIHMCDDLEFNTRYLEKCKKTIFIDVPLYYYFVNVNGVTGNLKLNHKVLTVFLAYDSVLSIFKLYSEKGTDNILYDYLKMKLNVNYRYFLENKTNEFGLYDDEKYRRVLKSKHISLLKKIYIFISFKFPILTSKIKYFVRKNMR